VVGEVKKRSFGVLASFRLSYRVLQTCAFAKRPMIGAIRQNPKILAPYGYSFSSNALTFFFAAALFKAAYRVIQMQGHLDLMHLANFLAMIHVRIIAEIFQGDVASSFKSGRDIPGPGLVAVFNAVYRNHKILKFFWFFYY
jgi:hypothetical protein